MISELLRIASVLAFFGMFYQIFALKSGEVNRARHIFVGYALAVIGLVIAVLITIRGFQFEGPFTPSLVIHFVTGAPFLVALLVTILLGRRVSSLNRGKRAHGFAGYVAGFLLVATTVFGTLVTFFFN